MKSIPGSPPKGGNFFHNYEINMKSIPALTEDAPAAPNGPPNAPPKGRRNPVFLRGGIHRLPFVAPCDENAQKWGRKGEFARAVGGAH